MDIIHFLNMLVLKLWFPPITVAALGGRNMMAAKRRPQARGMFETSTAVFLR